MIMTSSFLGIIKETCNLSSIRTFMKSITDSKSYNMKKFILLEMEHKFPVRAYTPTSFKKFLAGFRCRWRLTLTGSGGGLKYKQLTAAQAIEHIVNTGDWGEWKITSEYKKLTKDEEAFYDKLLPKTPKSYFTHTYVIKCKELQ